MVAMVRKSLAVLTVAVAVVALGGCGRELRAQQGQPITTPSTAADPGHGLRGGVAEAGDRGRDDGASEEVAGDR